MNMYFNLYDLTSLKVYAETIIIIRTVLICMQLQWQ